MTDILLIVLLLFVVVGALIGGLLVIRVRRSLDRRLTRMERRLDEPIKRSVADELARQTVEIREVLDGLSTTLTRRIDERTQAIRPGKNSVEQRTRRAVSHDVHALLTIHGALPLLAESLRLTSFSADPDTILHLTTLVAALPDDALVVEFGSGLSTVWMSAAAKRENRGIRVVSFDHEAVWGAETVAALDRLGLAAACEVRVTPLRPLPGAPEGSTPWYAVEHTEDLHDIALLVVDGPPATTGSDARYPAVPRLLARLAADARIVLDDTDRDEEKAIAERWLAELGQSRLVAVERILDRATVIRVGAARA